MKEKRDIILPTQANLTPKRRSKWPLSLLVVTFALFWMTYYSRSVGVVGLFLRPPKNALICPQPDSLSPDIHSELAITIDSEYASDDFRSQIATLLGGAVQIT